MSNGKVVSLAQARERKLRAYLLGLGVDPSEVERVIADRLRIHAELRANAGSGCSSENRAGEFSL